MAKGKSLKTVLKELKSKNPDILFVDIRNKDNKNWNSHILYALEHRLDSDIGKEWLGWTEWESLDIVEVNGNGTGYKEVRVVL